VSTQSSANPQAHKARGDKSQGHKSRADKGARAPAPRTAGQSSLLPVTALIIALATAATAGWLWRQLNDARNAQSELATAQARELAGLEAEIGQVSQSLAGIDDLNNAVGNTARQMASELSDLRADLGQMRFELVNRLNAGVQDHATTLLLGETEHLMRIAGYELGLRRDPTAALEALGLADERLAAMNDPLMVRVRETLAREIQALAAVPAPDIAGTAAILGTLADQAVSLPLRRAGDAEKTQSGAEQKSSGQSAINDDPSTSAADEESRWAELMDDLGRSLGRLVRVQKHDKNMAALLTPDDERLMRQNLQIKFETARLALLERRSQVYRDTLGEAQRWLRTYFDTNDEAVEAALRESDKMLAVIIEPMLPDISASLRQLRTARQTLTQATLKTTTQTASQATNPVTRKGPGS